MGCYYLQAKFGAFRPFVSGSFRPTAGFITPSAAYGLLLNLAGVDMRRDDGKSVMTLIRDDPPAVRIAIGALVPPRRHAIMQQLHNYPIGTSGKEHAKATKGSKYNIIPVKREVLSNIRAYIRTAENDALDEQIVEGLTGNRPRAYGLPFLGDNNYLIDRFEPVRHPEAAWWYEAVGEADVGIREGATRLTTHIDRADLSKTRSLLFAPSETARPEPPEGAWISLP